MDNTFPSSKHGLLYTPRKAQFRNQPRAGRPMHVSGVLKVTHLGLRYPFRHSWRVFERSLLLTVLGLSSNPPPAMIRFVVCRPRNNEIPDNLETAGLVRTTNRGTRNASASLFTARLIKENGVPDDPCTNHKPKLGFRTHSQANLSQTPAESLHLF
jgi:hypothetical protein